MSEHKFVEEVVFSPMFVSLSKHVYQNPGGLLICKITSGTSISLLGHCFGASTILFLLLWHRGYDSCSFFFSGSYILRIIFYSWVAFALTFDGIEEDM